MEDLVTNGLPGTVIQERWNLVHMIYFPYFVTWGCFRESRIYNIGFLLNINTIKMIITFFKNAHCLTAKSICCHEILILPTYVKMLRWSENPFKSRSSFNAPAIQNSWVCCPKKWLSNVWNSVVNHHKGKNDAFMIH